MGAGPKVRHGLDPEGFFGYVLTHFEPVWTLLGETPVVRNFVNRVMIDTAIYKTETRPYPFSTMSPYTSWASVTDRTYSSRHLAGKPAPANLPTPGAVAERLFTRGDRPILCPKSTVLFAYFAQWFTDGFLRTVIGHSDRNSSNHEIDLAPIYGLNKATTDVIRARSGGRLLSQVLHGEEYPPYLFDDAGSPKPEFSLLAENAAPFMPSDMTESQKKQFFATGGDRANVQIGYVMFNVLFLREHNRVAGLLAKEYADWDDDRLFETTRNILIVLTIKIVIEEYINHISPLAFKFFLDPNAFPNERWYRQNWMAIEFTLVYRWHMLIPDTLALGGRDTNVLDTMWNSDLITSRGLGALFDDASRQPAGRIGLYNTPSFLVQVESDSIQMGRDQRMAPYNDYFQQYGFPRLKKFEDISSDPATVRALGELYGSVDDVDFYAGLFADDTAPNSPVTTVIGTLVAIDAFSQALTNPLLNPHIFNEDTFSPLGMRMIEAPCSIAALLERNIPSAGSAPLATLTRTDWKRA